MGSEKSPKEKQKNEKEHQNREKTCPQNKPIKWTGTCVCVCVCADEFKHPHIGNFPWSKNFQTKASLIWEFALGFENPRAMVFLVENWLSVCAGVRIWLVKCEDGWLNAFWWEHPKCKQKLLSEPYKPIAQPTGILINCKAIHCRSTLENGQGKWKSKVKKPIC